jgi:hypothetical protein
MIKILLERLRERERRRTVAFDIFSLELVRADVFLVVRGGERSTQRPKNNKVSHRILSNKHIDV